MLYKFQLLTKLVLRGLTCSSLSLTMAPTFLSAKDPNEDFNDVAKQKISNVIEIVTVESFAEFLVKALGQICKLLYLMRSF